MVESPRVRVTKMFPTASPYCFMAGSSEPIRLAGECPTHRNLDMRAGFHSALLRSLHFDSWSFLWKFRWSVTNSLIPIFLPHHKVSRVTQSQPQRLSPVGSLATGDLPRGLPTPQSPASHLSLHNFARFKIAPGVLNAVARKGNDVGSVVINTEQFDSAIRRAGN